MSDVRSNMAAATTAAFQMALPIKVKVFMHLNGHNKTRQREGMSVKWLILVSAIF